MARTPIIKGIQIEIRDIASESKFSNVLKKAFPKPPVIFVEPSRIKEVPA